MIDDKAHKIREFADANQMRKFYGDIKTVYGLFVVHFTAWSLKTGAL